MHSPSQRLLAAALLAASVCATPVARAGLFDDEEARKAILDLRARITQMDEASRARGVEAAAAQAQRLEQMAEQLTVMRRGLLDLNNQLEAMRTDIAKLRGSDEQLQRDVAEMQKRQRDLSQGVDDRLRRFEPLKVTLDGKELLVDPEQKRAYDEAMAVVRTGDFDRAANALSGFERRFPTSPYADSVRYWTGNAFYGKRDYAQAITAFKNFVASAPDHPRAPEAWLALANSQAETKDTRSARKSLEDLVKAYPQSEAAQAARERLSTLK
jgi:tol-pal system protein YbgF